MAVQNGLAADGVAGPDTFMALGLHELVLLKQGRAARRSRSYRKSWPSALTGSLAQAPRKPCAIINRKTVSSPTG